jgi:predicted nucleotidyltransferase component of viral defense system
VLLPPQRFPFSSLYGEIPPFDLHVMDEREIFAEKIRAVYSRNKARDVYDLWYLARKRAIAFDSALAGKKLSSIGLKFDIRAFFSKLDEKKESWEKDLGSLINGELPSFGLVRKELADAFKPVA